MALLTLNFENKESLIIFDRFEYDLDLPKFKKNSEKHQQYTMVVQNGLTLNNSFSQSGFITNSTLTTNTIGQNGFVSYQQLSESTLSKLLKIVSLGYIKLKKKIKTTKVNYVFDLVLNNKEKLEKFEEKNKEYQILIDNAKKLGQTALVEKLELNKEVKKYENNLLVNNIFNFISEKSLLEFSKNCERGLKLDYIKNFTRIIPQNILDKKIKCDELELFDNYVILYYDPKNDSTSLTKKEIEKLKDPILFGVCSHTRKLYFVGDWIDELCNLTFDQIIQKMGQENTFLESQKV